MEFSGDGKKNYTSMGSGRGGWGKWQLENVQAYRQKISLGDQRARFAKEPDFQRRRAGQRFNYRRRARRRQLFTHDWEELSPSYFLMASIFLFLVMLQVLPLVGTPANAFAAGVSLRIVLITRLCYIFVSQYVSDGAPHHGIFAASPATSGAMCVNAACFIHSWMASVQVGLRVQWTSAFTEFVTLLHVLHHPPTLSAIHAYCSSRLPAPAPPITGDRPITRPACTDSSRLPARLRPAASPACRSDCPGRLAWTRPLLGRTAQRLHAGTPCHAGSHVGTLQKRVKKIARKKYLRVFLGCNNFFQEPGGYVRTSAPLMAPALFRSFGTSSRAPSRTSPGASSAQLKIAPLPAAVRAGCRTAIRGPHA